MFRNSVWAVLLKEATLRHVSKLDRNGMGHVHLQETAVKKRSNGMRTDRIHSKTFFFRPTPSWLPPGRPTRSIACCKLGLISQLTRTWPPAD